MKQFAQEAGVEEVEVAEVAGVVLMPKSSPLADRLIRDFAKWSAMTAGQKMAFKGTLTKVLNDDRSDGLAVATALEMQRKISELEPGLKTNGHKGPAHFAQEIAEWGNKDVRQQAGTKAALARAIDRAATPDEKAALKALKAEIDAKPTAAKSGKKLSTWRDVQAAWDRGIWRSLDSLTTPAFKAQVTKQKNSAKAIGDSEGVNAMAVIQDEILDLETAARAAAARKAAAVRAAVKEVLAEEE